MGEGGEENNTASLPQPAGNLWTFFTFCTDVASLVQPSHLGLGCFCCFTQGSEVQYSPPPALKNIPPCSRFLPLSLNTRLLAWRKHVSGAWSGTGSAWRRAVAASSSRTFLNALKGPCFLRFSRLVDRSPLSHYRIARLQERRAFQDASSQQTAHPKFGESVV